MSQSVHVIARARRATAAGCALVLLLLAQTAAFIARTDVFSHPSARPSVSEVRFARLRAKLAPPLTVGYLAPGQTGRGADTSPLWGFAAPDSLIEYYLAQYALAPVVVRNTPDGELVIGDFRFGRDPGMTARWIELEDAGEGVLLLRRAPHDPEP